MKTSELIKELKNKMDLFGDLPVKVWWDSGIRTECQFIVKMDKGEEECIVIWDDADEPCTFGSYVVYNDSKEII